MSILTFRTRVANPGTPLILLSVTGLWLLTTYQYRQSVIFSHKRINDLQNKMREALQLNAQLSTQLDETNSKRRQALKHVLTVMSANKKFKSQLVQILLVLLHFRQKYIGSVKSIRSNLNRITSLKESHNNLTRQYAVTLASQKVMEAQLQQYRNEIQVLRDELTQEQESHQADVQSFDTHWEQLEKEKNKLAERLEKKHLNDVAMREEIAALKDSTHVPKITLSELVLRPSINLFHPPQNFKEIGVSPTSMSLNMALEVHKRIVRLRNKNGANPKISEIALLSECTFWRSKGLVPKSWLDDEIPESILVWINSQRGNIKRNARIDDESDSLGGPSSVVGNNDDNSLLSSSSSPRIDHPKSSFSSILQVIPKDDALIEEGLAHIDRLQQRNLVIPVIKTKSTQRPIKLQPGDLGDKP